MTTEALGSSDKSSSPDLGRYGTFGHYSLWQSLSPQQYRDIEALGYGAIWAGGSPAAELPWVEPILEPTTNLKVATGIVNIWTADAGPVSESFHRIEKAYPGRFLLGIGVGHPEAHQEYRKPIDALREYLDKLDEYGVPKDRPRGGRTRAAGAQTVGAAVSGCASLSDDTGTHRDGPQADGA